MLPITFFESDLSLIRLTKRFLTSNFSLIIFYLYNTALQSHKSVLGKIVFIFFYLNSNIWVCLNLSIFFPYLVDKKYMKLPSKT